MNTGGYDKRISFISLAGIADGAGGTIPGRTELLTTFAAVEQVGSLSAAKFLQLQGRQDVLDKVYKVRIRYRSGFVPTEDMVIAYAGFDLSITNVELNGERHKREYLIHAVFNTKTNSIST